MMHYGGRGRVSAKLRGDYPTDYILVRQAWTCPDGSEHRVLVI